jgi:hypothetical protein
MGMGTIVIVGLVLGFGLALWMIFRHDSSRPPRRVRKLIEEPQERDVFVTVDDGRARHRAVFGVTVRGRAADATRIAAALDRAPEFSEPLRAALVRAVGRGANQYLSESGVGWEALDKAALKEAIQKSLAEDGLDLVAITVRVSAELTEGTARLERYGVDGVVGTFPTDGPYITVLDFYLKGLCSKEETYGRAYDLVDREGSGFDCWNVAEEPWCYRLVVRDLAKGGMDNLTVDEIMSGSTGADRAGDDGPRPRDSQRPRVSTPAAYRRR